MHFLVSLCYCLLLITGITLFLIVYIITLIPDGKIILMYLLTAVGLSPGGSSTVHIYTQTIHRSNIYYDRQSQQCFLLTCYFINYRMSYFRLHVSVIV